jgi:predicted nucleic acid-binding Zn ribbon protein
MFGAMRPLRLHEERETTGNSSRKRSLFLALAWLHPRTEPWNCWRTLVPLPGTQGHCLSCGDPSPWDAVFCADNSPIGGKQHRGTYPRPRLTVYCVQVLVVTPPPQPSRVRLRQPAHHIPGTHALPTAGGPSLPGFHVPPRHFPEPRDLRMDQVLFSFPPGQ